MRRSIACGFFIFAGVFAFGCTPDGGGDEADADPPPDAAVDGGSDAGPEPDANPEPEPDAGPDAGPAGCATDDDCEGPRRCIDGACVACLGDDDCVDGYLCRAGECVEGCEADDTCPDGTICVDGLCADGCRGDDGCAEGSVCIAEACVPCDGFDPCGADALPDGCPPPVDPDCGCADDADCDAGHICEGAACIEGCRDDADCADGICEDFGCLPLGLACRRNEDCGAGDRCEGARCVPDVADCVPDRLEPNDALDAFTPLMFGELYDRVGICPGDRDLYGALVPAGHTVRARLRYADPAPILTMRLLDVDGAVVADSVPGDATVFLDHTVEADGVHLVEIAGSGPDVRMAYALEVDIEAPMLCVDTDIYPDGDGDGFGVEQGAERVCLEPDEAREGFAREAGDCAPIDPWAHPEAGEICGDWVDDDCDGADVACPASQPAVQVPAWACGDDAPPANVYGWARFADGGGYFADGGCFVFFEGLPGEFYVTRHMQRVRQGGSCDGINGCVCPSLNGWPSYDRRLYAFTLAGDDPDDCDPIQIIDHGGERQPVSNHCRKYLYQMHFYDIPYSLVALGRAEFERRLALFPTVEVACAADLPHRNLPYQSLLTTPIERNPGWAPLPR